MKINDTGMFDRMIFPQINVQVSSYGHIELTLSGNPSARNLSLYGQRLESVS